MLERLNEMPFCKAKHSDSFIYFNWHGDAAQICCLQPSISQDAADKSPSGTGGCRAPLAPCLPQEGFLA